MCVCVCLCVCVSLRVALSATVSVFVSVAESVSVSVAESVPVSLSATLSLDRIAHSLDVPARSPLSSNFAHAVCSQHCLTHMQPKAPQCRSSSSALPNPNMSSAKIG